MDKEYNKMVAAIAAGHIKASLEDAMDISNCKNCYHGNHLKNIMEHSTVYKKHCENCNRNLTTSKTDNFRPKAEMLDGKCIIKERK